MIISSFIDPSIPHKTNKRGEYCKILEINYMDKEGKIHTKKININQDYYYNYVEAKNEKDKHATSWDNKPLKKKYGIIFDAKNNRVSSSNYLDRFRIRELTWLFLDSINHDYSFSDKEMIYVDIETEILDGFPDISNPVNKIQTIAITNNSTNNISIFGLKPINASELSYIKYQVNDYIRNNTNEKYNVYYKSFDTEHDMLKEALIAMSKASIVVGWNFIDFDWKYMMSRARRIDINLDFLKLRHDDLPSRFIVDDYMNLMKKYEYKMLSESASLNYASNKLINLTKVDYEGGLQELYDNDYKTYVFYNIIDTLLVKFIHKKINTIAVKATISNISKCTYYEGEANNKIAESIIQAKLKEENKYLYKSDYNSYYIKFKNHDKLLEKYFKDIVEIEKTRNTKSNISYVKLNIVFKKGFIKELEKKYRFFNLYEKTLSTNEKDFVSYLLEYNITENQKNGKSKKINKKFEISNIRENSKIEYNSLITTEVDDEKYDIIEVTIPLSEMFFDNFQQEPKTWFDKYKNDMEISWMYSIEGGYVYANPKTMNRYIMVFDFASLYPSIVKNYNISPEAYIGMENHVILDDDKEYIRTDFGAVFSKEQESIMKKFIDFMYGERKKFKKRQEKREAEILLIENELKKRGINF